MSQHSFSFPPEFQESPAFRRLVDGLRLQPGAVTADLTLLQAAWLLLVLYRELAMAAREGAPVGRVAAADQAFYRRAAHCDDFFKLLTESRLMVQDGEDFVAPLFALLNKDLAPSHRSLAQRGGDARAFHRALAKAEDNGLALALKLSAEKLVTSSGETLGVEAVKRATWLVCAVDCALFKPPRPSGWAVSQTLLENADAVCRQYSNEQIKAFCTALSARRGNPLVADLTTEKLLPKWTQLYTAMETEDPE